MSDEPKEPEQVFYVSTAGRLPREVTLSGLRGMCQILTAGGEFNEPTTLGTRWQGWPIPQEKEPALMYPDWAVKIIG
jgi:hypothetical protein